MKPELDLQTLNAMPVDAFVAALGGIYEHSPWIPRRVAGQRPFASLAALHGAMTQVVARAALAEQLTLLRAHPELAGREAAAGTLTAHSSAEQRGAGLVDLSAEESRQVSAFNARYREKFGFPFIIAVRRHTRAGIFAEMARRLDGADPVAERELALAQVNEIARLRLESLIAV
jgi:2-oxo-4-hydroxy-4-carboxy-5-ureidoimidazoline decarboxylase